MAKKKMQFDVLFPRIVWHQNGLAWNREFLGCWFALDTMTIGNYRLGSLGLVQQFAQFEHRWPTSQKNGTISCSFSAIKSNFRSKLEQLHSSAQQPGHSQLTRLNHSCEPNVRLLPGTQNGCLCMVAAVDISSGEDAAFNGWNCGVFCVHFLLGNECGSLLILFIYIYLEHLQDNYFRPTC